MKPHMHPGGAGAWLFVFALFWSLWRSSGGIGERLLLRPAARRSASARTVVTVGSNFARSAIFSVGGLVVLAAGSSVTFRTRTVHVATSG